VLSIGLYLKLNWIYSVKRLQVQTGPPCPSIFERALENKSEKGIVGGMNLCDYDNRLGVGNLQAETNGLQRALARAQVRGFLQPTDPKKAPNEAESMRQIVRSLIHKQQPPDRQFDDLVPSNSKMQRTMPMHSMTGQSLIETLLLNDARTSTTVTCASTNHDRGTGTFSRSDSLVRASSNAREMQRWLLALHIPPGEVNALCHASGVHEHSAPLCTW
jgi:hypothetical protein